MSNRYQYKPKLGLDMRIRPPKEGDEERAADVHARKPGEVKCEWPGCLSNASAKAPKSRELLNEHYQFCLPHAAEYNKSWNYYAGMSEGEVAARQAEERQTGGRPTWTFRAGRASRESAAVHSKGVFRDSLGVFGAGADGAPAPEGRQVGKIERKALADMDLDPGATPEDIRVKYTALLKRLHPDSNGGDRSMEDKLQRVIRAYKALKAAKLA